jgi:hypothetical protein
MDMGTDTATETATETNIDMDADTDTLLGQLEPTTCSNTRALKALKKNPKKLNFKRWCLI